jgi:hypothetical protein
VEFQETPDYVCKVIPIFDHISCPDYPTTAE